MKLDLAISPCPNDTFIFHQFIQPGFLGHELELHLEDVEELNRRAIEEKRHAITKLSYYAIARLRDDYRLLDAGGALGEGCGPILICGPKVDAEAVREDPHRIERVLIPGRWTTANLLLRLRLAAAGADLIKIRFEPTRYDRIMPSLMSGEASYGVIIHEERFTFAGLGLKAVMDLGEWWEGDTKLPIPLGGIAVRRDIPDDVADVIQAKIRESLRMAWQSPEASRTFVKEHAQAIQDDVIQSHIDLYVNHFSEDPGDTGREAIRVLFERADQAELV